MLQSKIGEIASKTFSEIQEKKEKMKFGTFVQLLGSALTISALLYLPAQAGINGQQLEIATRAATQVRVTGRNQNGQTVTWTA